jgi:cytochrome c-type biogenesis protein CcmH/NrfG
MKKETVILSVVIAFLVGFITGATVAILKGKKSAARSVAVQPPPAAPTTTPVAPLTGPPSAEVNAKIQALKDIVQKDPKNLSALVELGNLYFDSDQPREAVEAYGKYLAVKPDNADVRTDMGIMYRKLGDSDRALQEFKKAAQTDPRHVNSRYNIGVVLLHDKQDIKGAIKAWEDYLKVDSNSERAERVKTQMERMRAMVK